MTDAERNKRFRAARKEVLAFKVQLQRATASEITRLLKEADAHIRAILAAAPSDYQAWALPQLQQDIASALQDFQRAAAARLGTAAGSSWEAGLSLIDAPLSAGGLQIVGQLPAIDTRQLTAMRAFMTSRIADISTTIAGRINAQLGLVIIGAQSPADTIAAIEALIEGGRSRAITITRTELGRAFSVAAHERAQEAADIVPGMQKQWRRSGKIHSRIHHDSIDGQVRDVNEPFTLGNGVQIMFPRDPAAPAAETINCGCESLPFMASWDVKTPGRRPFSDEEKSLSKTKRDMAASGFDTAA